jgi:hypothetical protein
MSDEFKPLTPRDIVVLAHELSGVIVDVEQGNGFDSICLDTIKRVQASLITLSEEFRLIKQSEKEGWRYSDELEQERVRLTAKLNG